MPTFINPKLVHVETGGGKGSGGLVAAAVVVLVVGAGGGAAVWLVQEILSAWKELAVIAGGTAIVMAVRGDPDGGHVQARKRAGKEAAKAEIRPSGCCDRHGDRTAYGNRL